MKKLMCVAAAAAALVAGSAFAQSAECQAGSAWGPKPGCDSSGGVPAQVYGNSGWSPDMIYNNNGYGVPYALGALGGVLLNDGRWVPNNYAYNTPYTRSRRDRDGDGIPNWQDRYPDDPRYR